ncbi:MAG: hypothetical protein WBR17_04345, partial [Paraburkholderia sp.]|jgi:hypothetical protein|uniref:hypothetical protein n=1 Tax=Paraburkholderia sp. TaxID=1926495 RepID=UPI003C6BCD7B
LERRGGCCAGALTDVRESATGRQKKARLGSRADKGLEIFFVNEKVCFGKQRFQYSGLDEIDYSHNQQSSVAIATTIIFYDLSRCFFASITVANEQRDSTDSLFIPPQ